jgi:hypothetical protein
MACKCSDQSKDERGHTERGTCEFNLYISITLDIGCLEEQAGVGGLFAFRLKDLMQS